MTPGGTTVPAPGFADPPRDAQRAFRAVLDALAHPTRPYPLAGPAEPPAALGPGLAAVALTLLDGDCSAWLGGALGSDGDTAAWLAFHTGVRRTEDPAAADFVIAGPETLPPLESLSLGTDEMPNLSATVVLDIRGCSGRPARSAPDRFTAEGPGINGTATVTAPWAPPGFADSWRGNTRLFPRGVDLLLVDSGTVTGLPRTTRLSTEALSAEPEV